MADYAEDVLAAATQGGDPYESLLRAATGVPEPQQVSLGGLSDQGTPQVAPQDTQMVSPAPVPPREDTYVSALGTAYGQAFSRGVQSLKAVPSSVESIARQFAGDEAGAIAAAQRAQEIEKAGGEGTRSLEGLYEQWDWRNVNSYGELGLWLAEKLGENTPNILATGITGGAGALAANMAAKRLMLSTASRQALLAAGGGGGMLASTIPMEASGTATELFEATGRVHGGEALTAGALKGLLEIYTPMRVGSALFNPGKQLGSSVLKATGKVALGEAATEVAQESIDIAYRKHADPGYNFFGEGPTLLGPGAWRLLEAGAAGFAVGGVIGAPAAVAEKLDTRSTQPLQDVEGAPWFRFADDLLATPGHEKFYADTELRQSIYDVYSRNGGDITAAIATVEASPDAFRAEYKDKSFVERTRRMAAMEAQPTEMTVEEEIAQLRLDRMRIEASEAEDSPKARRAKAILKEGFTPEQVQEANLVYQLIQAQDRIIDRAGGAKADQAIKDKQKLIERYHKVDPEEALWPKDTFDGDTIGGPTKEEQVQQAASRAQAKSDIRSGKMPAAISHKDHLLFMRHFEALAKQRDVRGRVGTLGEQNALKFEWMKNGKDINKAWMAFNQDYEGVMRAYKSQRELMKLGPKTEAQVYDKADDAETKSMEREKKLGDPNYDPYMEDVLASMKQPPPRKTVSVKERVRRFLGGKTVEQEVDPAIQVPPLPPDRYAIPPPGPPPVEGATVEITRSTRNQLNAVIKVKGRKVGKAYIREYPTAVQIGQFSIDEKWQRQGLGTWFQNVLESELQKPAIPDTMLSAMEYGRWMKYDPKAVSAFRDVSGTGDAWVPNMMSETNYGQPEPGSKGYWQSIGVKIRENKELDKLKNPSEEKYPVSEGVGPVTYIRNMLLFRATDDVTLAEANPSLPRSDAFALSPILSTMHPTQQDMYLDMIEANTNRYAVRQPNGGLSNMLLTDVDLQLDLGGGFAQATKPTVLKVDQGTLVPEGVTATPFDMPIPGSMRIWFLPKVSEENRARAMIIYRQLYRSVIEPQRALRLKGLKNMWEMAEQILPAYTEMLQLGMRIIPSRGSSILYAGGSTLRGDEVELDDVNRSNPVALINTRTGQIRIGEAWAQDEISIVGPHWSVVSLDLNKFREGEISAVPFRDMGRIPDFQFRKDVKEEDKVGLVELADHVIPLEGVDWTEDTIKGWRAIVRKGIYLPVTTSSDLIVTTAEAKVDDVTFGINWKGRDEEGASAYELFNFPFFPGRATTVEMSHGLMLTGGNQANMLMDTARWLDLELRKLVPFVNSVLKDMNIEDGMKIKIQAKVDPGMGSALAWLTPQEGNITFAADQWVQFRNSEFGNSMLLGTLMHEVGHAVTLSHYAALPVEVKQKIRYAYKMALLMDRVDPLSAKSRVAHPLEPGRSNDPQYYLSFVEWLAEQFRRFSASDPQMRTELDHKYKAISVAQERFVRAWLDKVGPTATQDLFAPDYQFSAFMHYIRKFGGELNQLRKVKHEIMAKMEQSTLYTIGVKLFKTNELTMITRNVISAIESMEGAFPKERFRINLVKELQGAGPDAVARMRVTPFDDINPVNWSVIELAVGAMTSGLEVGQARVMIAHELVHTLRAMNLMTDPEFGILLDAARKKGGLDPRVLTQIIEQVRAEQKKYNLSEEAYKLMLDKVVNEETVAYFIQDYANTGLAVPEAATIMDKILELLGRIIQVLKGDGFKNKEDVIRAIFNGEMAKRQTHETEVEGGLSRFMAALTRPETIYPDYVEEISPGTYAFIEGGRTDEFILVQIYGNLPPGLPFSSLMTGPGLEKPTLPEMAKQLGITLPLVKSQANFEIADHGVNVEMIYSNQLGGAQEMMRFFSKNIDLPILHPPVFTDEGYAVAKVSRAVDPNILKLYLKSGKSYYSPKYVMQQVVFNQKMVEHAKALYEAAPNPERFANLQAAEKSLAHFKRLQDKIAVETIYNPEVMGKFFNLAENTALDGIQGSILRSGVAADNAQLQEVLRDSPPAGSTQDLFTKNEIQSINQSFAVGENQAPQMPEAMYMRRIIERALGTNVSAEALAYLKQSRITEEKDRIGYFTRMYWSILQLAWRNRHIRGLLDYVQAIEMFNQSVTKWHNRADDIAKIWDRRVASGGEQQRLAEFLFWLTEQNYRSPAEVAAGIVRHPTKAELAAQLRIRTFTPDMKRVFDEIYVHPSDVAAGAKDSIFGDFLNEVELVSEANLVRTIKNPAALGIAVAKLRAEMHKLREKPYFPMMRFGKYVVTVRDGASHSTILHVEAFGTLRQMEEAIPNIRSQFPLDNIHARQAPENTHEFMGLPPVMLEQIRTGLNTLPGGLTADQLNWLEEFERMNLPDNTFRTKWLPQSGTSGHSMDAFRTFSNYFINGSRYLARIKYGWMMLKAISDVRGTISQLPVALKRQMIVDYMDAHLKYVMEAGKDWAKLKSFIALWQLGYSPAAAAMNFTQNTVTWSYLAGLSSTAKGTQQMLTSIKAVRNLKDGYVTSGYGNYGAAREEAINQQRIEIGQAAELGAYAEGANLLTLMGGTKLQKAHRKATHYGMWMFQKMEHANREIAFHAAWELATRDKNDAKIKAELDEIFYRFPKEINDLVTRLSTPTQAFTLDDAKAFMFAKTAIDRTQGVYSPYARPPFMRGKNSGVILIFFQYMQMMTYAYRFNPGAVQLTLISIFLYGLSGAIPGGEDLSEIAAAVARRLFGIDFDLKVKAREYVRDMTRGTVMDEVGPDLALHGVSRYGFGLGLLPEGWGLGKFDASANGSLGKLVPGLFELAHGAKTYAEPDRYITDAAERMAGAGYGYMFSVIQFMMESGGTVDSKTWEALVPRSARALIKAHRLATEGETNRTGAKVVGFDVSDPEDLAALVAQAMGFSPTKVSAYWEMTRAKNDEYQTYKGRRIALYGQYARAIKEGEKSAYDDVQDAIREYNKEVREKDPSMVIIGDQIRQSMMNRGRQKALGEVHLPGQRSQMPVSRRIQDIYPNVKVPNRSPQVPSGTQGR